MSILRISLVMLARKFDVTPAYEEWDQVHGIPQKRNCRFEGERRIRLGRLGHIRRMGFRVGLRCVSRSNSHDMWKNTSG
jgi:hypothetical protein